MLAVQRDCERKLLQFQQEENTSKNSNFNFLAKSYLGISTPLFILSHAYHIITSNVIIAIQESDFSVRDEAFCSITRQMTTWKGT